MPPPLKPSTVIEEIAEESEEGGTGNYSGSQTEQSESNGLHNDSRESNNSVTLFESENPWDLVPDQPANRSSNSLVIPVLPVNGNSQKSELSQLNTNNSTNTTTITAINKVNKIEELSGKSNTIETGQNLMDDPFDADWVSLALNETNNQNQQQPL